MTTSAHIEKVYRAGNCWGVVYVTDELNKAGTRYKRVSTIIGGWDAAPSAVRDCKYRLKERGPKRREVEALVGAALSEREISKIKNAAPVEERATIKQIGYAHDLAMQLAYDAPWCVTAGSYWFKSPPSDAQIAAMSKRECSSFISAMIEKY